MKSVYKIGDLEAYICRYSSDRILEKLVDLYPLVYIKKSRLPSLYQHVRVAYDIFYNDVKIGGIYYKTDNIIIINGGILNIVDPDCNIYLDDKYRNRFVSIVVGHELIHYVFYNDFDRNFVKPIAYKFYKTFWQFLVKPEYLNKVAESNLSLALGMYDENRKLKQYQYFRTFLGLIKEHDILKPDKETSIIVLDSLVTGKSEVKLNRDVEKAFEKAYNAIYDGIPKRTKFGQELLDISEIFSCASQTYTNKAKKVTIRFMKRFR
ncbi:MAG: hypothetical protein QW478_06770 [Candidatus Micrarchaeaceae archaeon]